MVLLSIYFNLSDRTFRLWQEGKYTSCIIYIFLHHPESWNFFFAWFACFFFIMKNLAKCWFFLFFLKHFLSPKFAIFFSRVIAQTSSVCTHPFFWCILWFFFLTNFCIQSSWRSDSVHNWAIDRGAYAPHLRLVCHFLCFPPFCNYFEKICKPLMLLCFLVESANDRSKFCAVA